MAAVPGSIQTPLAEMNSMRFLVRALALVVVTVWVLFTAPATYADPLSKPALPGARNHLMLGNRLYGVRSFEEAAAEYKAGALIEPAPVFDYNLGQCFRQLGKYQEAIWHYERFLARGKPQGELLDAVNGFITQMKSELDKKAMTQKPIEPAPLPTPQSSLPGSQSNQVRPARTAAWYEDSVGWVLTGSGVAGLAAGAGLLLDARSLRNDANANPDQRGSEQAHDKASTRSLVGGVIGMAGAGLLVTGLLKLAIHSQEPSRATGWNISITGNDLMVSGKF
jgi:tetratricopeptide (TPR) repeat protein